MHMCRTDSVMSSNSTDGRLRLQHVPECACTLSQKVSLPSSAEVGRGTLA